MTIEYHAVICNFRQDMYTVLVADDERSMTEFFEVMLSREGCRVLTASSAEEAMKLIAKGGLDLVITDINMPTAGGMEVIRKAGETDPDLPVIMITAYASTITAIEAMKLGAYDYISKPFNNDEIKLVVAKALERRSDKTHIKQLERKLAHTTGSHGDLIGNSPAMKNMLSMIKKVADSRSTVFITGESGVGKELVARAIHDFSERRGRAFNSINCGALPEELLESELFGHQKGAFTSAHADKIGLLENSDHGTFFLDEVGEAPLSVQVKLLRFLQEREIRRVGGTKDIKVDIRLIAATNRNVEKMIEEGLFREDFYYRLNIIPIHIPPLRDRREDIPVLANRFMAKYAKANQREVRSISVEAMDMLEQYTWRGNVRELENVIERAVVLTSGSVIVPEYLPESVRTLKEKNMEHDLLIPEDGIDLENEVSKMEKDLLFKALSKAGGVKKEAARLLSLSFRSFRYKLAKYKIDGGNRDE